MNSRLHIGLSGWSYDAWKDGFYKGVPRSKWLPFYAEHLKAVEVNATFYGSLKPSTFEKWRKTVPEDFIFTVKGHKYITHNKKLDVQSDSIVRQREQSLPLCAQLAAVLWQLPAKFHKNLERLEHFGRLLNKYWPETRHVLEFRHASWFDTETEHILNEHDLGHAVSDAADWPRWDVVTSGLAYIRLHGREVTYQSAYGPAGVQPWAERIRALLDADCPVHVYFDNTEAGAAPWDAQELLKKMIDP